MANIRFNKSFNVNRVVKALVRTILALYVGGTIMTALGGTMANTSSPFYNGLGLIGWTVGNQVTNGTAGWSYTCSGGGTQDLINATALGTPSNCITSTTSTASVLSVIGIIAIAQIVTEFISW